jgi:hypothetical protein
MGKTDRRVTLAAPPRTAEVRWPAADPPSAVVMEWTKEFITPSMAVGGGGQSYQEGLLVSQQQVLETGLLLAEQPVA